MIAIDPRVGTTKTRSRSERVDQLVESFESLKVPCEVRQLEFGDFAFANHDASVHVGVELKTVRDLVNSMQSGRLTMHQIPGLLENYNEVYLIVEGFYRARRQDGLAEVPAGKQWRPLQLGRRPVRWDEIEAFLTSIEHAGVFVRRTRTSMETTRAVRVLYRWHQKTDHTSFRVSRHPPPPTLAFRRETPHHKRLREVAMGLTPGMGYERGSAAAEHFENVLDMVLADDKKWQFVPGIGKKLAQNIVAGIVDDNRTTGR